MHEGGPLYAAQLTYMQSRPLRLRYFSTNDTISDLLVPFDLTSHPPQALSGRRPLLRSASAPLAHLGN